MHAAVDTLQFLKRSIQEGAHDSTQDALAAMDLALLKIRKGEPSTAEVHQALGSTVGFSCKCISGIRLGGRVQAQPPHWFNNHLPG
jgi:hypothetical protein